MDTEAITPAEFITLRDQLALDLGAISSPETARRIAEYLLASGLVHVEAIRLRIAQVTRDAILAEGSF